MTAVSNKSNHKNNPRRSGLGPTCLLAISLLTVPGSPFADENVVDISQVEGFVLPLEQIMTKASEKLNGHVLEAELLQRGTNLVYEIVVLEKKGVVREYDFDARTGKLIGEIKGN